MIAQLIEEANAVHSRIDQYMNGALKDAAGKVVKPTAVTSFLQSARAAASDLGGHLSAHAAAEADAAEKAAQETVKVQALSDLLFGRPATPAPSATEAPAPAPAT